MLRCAGELCHADTGHVPRSKNTGTFLNRSFINGMQSRSYKNRSYNYNRTKVRFAHPADRNFGSTTFVLRASRLLFCELRITPEAFISQDAISCEITKVCFAHPKDHCFDSTAFYETENPGRLFCFIKRRRHRVQFPVPSH